MRARKVHELKTWPEDFEATMEGRKLYEVRRNDRDFREGDVIVLREYISPGADAIQDERERRAYYENYNEPEPGLTGRVAGPYLVGHVTASRALPEGWCGFALIKLVREAS